MHLSNYMRLNALKDEDVAIEVGRNRATVSRWRRNKLRPDWQSLDRIETFTGGKVTANDWTDRKLKRNTPASSKEAE